MNFMWKKIQIEKKTSGRSPACEIQKISHVTAAVAGSDYTNEEHDGKWNRSSGNSSWVFNVILDKKKDDSTRFVADCRKMDNVIVKSSSDIAAQRIWLQRTGQFLREEDCCKTAFMTNRGLMEMCITVFGLCNSQPTYQRIINTTLQDIINAESLVDDVAVCQIVRWNTPSGFTEILRIHFADENCQM